MSDRSNTAVPMILGAGTRLGRYEIRSPLGAGGMGEVYRAHDHKLDRDVAILSRDYNQLAHSHCLQTSDVVSISFFK